MVKVLQQLADFTVTVTDSKGWYGFKDINTVLHITQEKSPIHLTFYF